MRLMEGVRLRVKDLDFAANHIVVRDRFDSVRLCCLVAAVRVELLPMRGFLPSGPWSARFSSGRDSMRSCGWRFIQRTLRSRF